MLASSVLLLLLPVFVLPPPSPFRCACLRVALLPWSPRPLIKLHIVWKKDGALLSNGISDYNRRLTITNPTVSDAGFYECEAVLRSSSVAPVTRGAYLSVLGKSGKSTGAPLLWEKEGTSRDRSRCGQTPSPPWLNIKAISL